MKNEIVKAIVSSMSLDQHTTGTVAIIVEEIVGYEDKTSDKRILSRISVLIVSQLKEMGIIAERQIDRVLVHIQEAMGVFSVER